MKNERIEIQTPVGGEGKNTPVFEKEIRLVSNPKAQRGKVWIARIDLQNEELEFLSPIEGSRVKGVYEFENGQFYLTAEDHSSHKNSRQYYTLYLATNNELKIIASIDFINARKEFSAIDDDVKKVLKEAYKTEKNGRKVINSLIKTAKYYAQRENIQQIDKKQLILDEINRIAEKYNVSFTEIAEILKEVQ